MTIALTLLACSVDADLVELDVDGVERSYYLYVPEALPSNAPVILAFHGGGGKGDHTGRTMVRFTGLNTLADERGFVAVYPSSLGGNWNDGRGMSSSDDLAYVDALIDDVVARTGADPERVYGHVERGLLLDGARLPARRSIRGGGRGGLDAVGGPVVRAVPPSARPADRRHRGSARALRGW
ncbi:MAG: hypothetical protein KC621_08715 [Myxococcales bacterium]|nr:hypothetical protein [Myxococcales bacterium]